jgi:hypothetical protein
MQQRRFRAGHDPVTGRLTKTHGDTDTPEYRAWMSLIGRCCNPSHQQYPNYGGRGITVCTRWRESYGGFLADVGRRPSAQHSIERIDNDRGYEPGNVRWATAAEQQHNKRNNHHVTIDGERRTLAEWAIVSPVSRRGILLRLRNGWTPERAVFEPAHHARKVALETATSCANGHPYVGSNFQIRQGRYRRCRICARAYTRAYKQRRRAHQVEARN